MRHHAAYGTELQGWSARGNTEYLLWKKEEQDELKAGDRENQKKVMVMKTKKAVAMENKKETRAKIREMIGSPSETTREARDRGGPTKDNLRRREGNATATVTDQDCRATVRSYANAGTRRGYARYHASALSSRPALSFPVYALLSLCRSLSFLL